MLMGSFVAAGDHLGRPTRLLDLVHWLWSEKRPTLKYDLVLIRSGRGSAPHRLRTACTGLQSHQISAGGKLHELPHLSQDAQLREICC